MKIQVSGKNMDLGKALRDHVTEKLDEGVRKYFNRDAEATVTFSRERHLVECDLTTHLASGVFLNAHGEDKTAYGAFEESLERLEKRIRRYKRRLKNHHTTTKEPLPAEQAAYYLLQPLPDETEQEPEAAGPGSAQEDPAPVVIAETHTILREMTVSSAVMQLDLVDKPAIVFRNAAHGGINVVYKRQDGNIGWVDPDRK